MQETGMSRDSADMFVFPTVTKLDNKNDERYHWRGGTVVINTFVTVVLDSNKVTGRNKR
jgi:hypothetical protein